MIRHKDTLKQDPEKEEWVYIEIPTSLIPLEIMGTGKKALKIRGNIKTSTWASSMFHNLERQCFVLAIRKEVRDKQKIKIGDMVAIAFEIL